MPDLEARQRISALETEVGTLEAQLVEISNRLAMIGMLPPGGEVIQPGVIDYFPPLDIRMGNGLQPGYGFSGLRIAYPPVTYNNESWNLVGVDDDVMKVGIRASDGTFLAGAGDVILDEDGIQLVQGTGDTNSLRWIDGVWTVGQMWASGTFAAGILGNIAVSAADAKFANLQFQGVSGGGAATRYTRLTLASRGDVGMAGGVKYRFFTTLDADGTNRFLLDLLETAAIFNPQKADLDFRIHGASVDDVIKVDASADKAYYLGTEIGTGAGGGGDILEVQVFS